MIFKVEERIKGCRKHVQFSDFILNHARVGYETPSGGPWTCMMSPRRQNSIWKGADLTGL